MILGALIDAGVPLVEVRKALGSLAIAPDTVWTERVMRAGIGATKFCVRGEDEPPDHANDHENGHEHPHDGGHFASGEPEYHVHRSLADIDRLIDGSALSAAGKARARNLFATLGDRKSVV